MAYIEYSKNISEQKFEYKLAEEQIAVNLITISQDSPISTQIYIYLMSIYIVFLLA